MEVTKICPARVAAAQVPAWHASADLLDASLGNRAVLRTGADRISWLPEESAKGAGTVVLAREEAR